MNWKKLFLSTSFVTLLSSLPLLCRMIFFQAPSTHPEANCFIMHYNSGEMLLKLIFDPLRTDWASFQARELSYIVDYFDARFIYFCIKSHHAHFYSLSAIILLIASAALIHRKLKNLYPQAHPGLLILPPLMYVCSFMNDTGFFRSSKPVTSFLLIWIFFTFAGILKTPEKFQSLRSLLSGIIALLLIPGFDRMGFFIAAVCAAAGAVLMLIFSCDISPGKTDDRELFKKPLAIFSFAALASVIISLVYNFVIAPVIIESLNGYYPSFKYQTFQTAPGNFIDGLIFILKNYGGFFLPERDNAAIACGVLITGLLTYASITIWKKERKKWLIPLAWAGIFTASIICTGMMIARHPMIPALPVGAYFQVFGTALCGIYAVIILEYSEIKLRQFMAILAIAACLTPFAKAMFPGLQEPAHMQLHRETTGYTIELLNDPELQQTKILPTSSIELIKFFRSREKMEQ